MTSNQELYGTDGVPEIPAEVIVRRVELLNDRLEDVLAVDMMVRDTELMNRIVKAIEFWESINER